MNFSACVYVQQQTLGTLRHIALSKGVQVYCSEDYVGLKYKLLIVIANKYVHTVY